MLRHLTGADVPNTAWPSDNPDGVPTLRLDRQAELVDLPFARWGRATRKSRMRGTWHFYTDDYRFSRAAARPQDVVNSACVAAVEMNFSVHAQAPRAVALWQTYRKRWLARFWQEQGIRVLADMNVAEEHADVNAIGIPPGWRSFATRGGEPERLEREYGRARGISGASGLLFVVYGGGKGTSEICRARGWLWFAEESDAARGRVP
jgi:hypothetical protein